MPDLDVDLIGAVLHWDRIHRVVVQELLRLAKVEDVGIQQQLRQFGSLLVPVIRGNDASQSFTGGMSASIVAARVMPVPVPECQGTLHFARRDIQRECQSDCDHVELPPGKSAEDAVDVPSRDGLRLQATGLEHPELAYSETPEMHNSALQKEYNAVNKQKSIQLRRHTSMIATSSWRRDQAGISRWVMDDGYAADVLLQDKVKIAKLRRSEKLRSLPTISARLVHDTRFDAFFSCMIVASTAFTGVEAQLGDDHVWLRAIDYTLFALFLAEIYIRISVYRRAFFTTFDRGWNIFDLACVLMSIPNLVIGFLPRDQFDNGAGVLVIIRVFRMARVVRIMRLVKVLKDLRSMTAVVLHTLPSLFWSIAFILILNYMFSISLLEAALQGLKEGSLNELEEKDLAEHFGSLSKSMFTLFLCSSAGMNWGDAARALKGVSFVYTIVLSVHQCLVLFAVLNVVNGFFCSDAIDMARSDKEHAIAQQLEDKQIWIEFFHDLFDEMDIDGSGQIGLPELMASMDDARLQAYFSHLNIPTSRAWTIFRLLDADGTGEVSADEFVTGILRIRGEAKCIDVRSVHHDLKHAQSVLTEFMEFTEKRFDDVEMLLSRRAPWSPVVSMDL
eukprot:TRINITY_DN6373_c0_g2_i1.p1 TRINITY_DN6373_c0_g2~~TRINITY_DN6373_c0_g2_i1.p1  ORF type:complete len:617 (-),score=81.32 TRINITY_DN6373_c0_g2_i1:16-1866(-)